MKLTISGFPRAVQIKLSSSLISFLVIVQSGLSVCAQSVNEANGWIFIIYKRMSVEKKGKSVALTQNIDFHRSALSSVFITWDTFINAGILAGHRLENVQNWSFAFYTAIAKPLILKRWISIAGACDSWWSGSFDNINCRIGHSCVLRWI